MDTFSTLPRQSLAWLPFSTLSGGWSKLAILTLLLTTTKVLFYSIRTWPPTWFHLRCSSLACLCQQQSLLSCLLLGDTQRVYRLPTPVKRASATMTSRILQSLPTFLCPWVSAVRIRAWRPASSMLLMPIIATSTWRRCTALSCRKLLQLLHLHPDDPGRILLKFLAQRLSGILVVVTF